MGDTIMYRTRRNAAVVLPFIVLFAAGCAGPLKQYGEQVNMVKSPTMDWGADEGRIGVLNAVVNFGSEAYSSGVSRSLSDTLLTTPQKEKVIPVEQTLSAINRSGLAGDHAAMMAEYTRTGILNKLTLNDIGRAVNARYIMVPSMPMFSQTTSGRMSVPLLGMRLFQTRISYIRLSAQVWDTTTGDMVCDASGEATLSVEDVREQRVTLEDVASKLWKRILQEMKLSELRADDTNVNTERPPAGEGEKEAIAPRAADGSRAAQIKTQLSSSQ
jgi:hypothetical protein